MSKMLGGMLHVLLLPHMRRSSPPPPPLPVTLPEQQDKSGGSMFIRAPEEEARACDVVRQFAFSYASIHLLLIKSATAML